MRLALNFRRVDPSKGGAETYVADLCRRLVAAGHHIDLFANSWEEGVLPRDVRFHEVPISGHTRRAQIWSFALNSERAMRGESYDCTVGFINTWFQDVLIPQGGVQRGSLECNANRFPAGLSRQLYRWGKMCNPKFSLYEQIERRQYDPARGTHVVAVSQMVQEHLRRFHDVSPERIHVIPNAIDSGRLSVPDAGVARRTFRAEHKLGDRDLVGLFVGHNFRLKGLPPLLDAIAQRRGDRPDARPVHLVVCGGGRLGPVRRWVDRLGLQDCVHVVGFASSIAAAYYASDFFVLPTYYDPCSLVVFEALCCGLPVITTAFNGAGEVITSGREGFVVSAPDARDELVRALDGMVDDAARSAMAERAVTLGKAQSFDRHVNRLVQVFEQVAAAKRARTPHGRTSTSSISRIDV